ncbi:MAG: hypothetical protein WBE26_03475 [Phycisphaerae bacterium]
MGKRELARGVRCGHMNGLIDNADVCCVFCTYCPNGLPIRGRCPECGAYYVADGPDPAEAVRRFNAILPRHWRFWMSAEVERERSAVFLFLLLILAAALNAAVFVLLQYAAVRLASPRPWGRSPYGPVSMRAEFVHTIFGEVGCGWAKPQPWDGGGPYLWGIVVLGHVFLALVIRAWYALTIRAIHPYKRVAASLGNLAMGSVLPVLTVPMFLVVVWQYWNVSDPGWYSPGLLGSAAIIVRFLVQGRGDVVSLAAPIALWVGVALAAVLLFTRHRCCMAKVREALGAVRLALDEVCSAKTHS